MSFKNLFFCNPPSDLASEILKQYINIFKSNLAQTKIQWDDGSQKFNAEELAIENF